MESVRHMKEIDPLVPSAAIDPRGETGQLVPPAVLQLKRLTRDLRARVHDFNVLLAQVLDRAGPPDRAAFQRLAADIDRMRQSARASGEIARASMAAIDRGDPNELVALRDQLMGYLAALDRAPQITPTQPKSQPGGCDDPV